MVLLQTSPCDHYECQNGAQCIVVQQEPVCRCLAGFAGQKCEKLITVNFVGKDSYVELPPAKVRPQANISLQVSHNRLDYVFRQSTGPIGNVFQSSFILYHEHLLIEEIAKNLDEGPVHMLNVRLRCQENSLPVVSNLLPTIASK